VNGGEDTIKVYLGMDPLVEGLSGKVKIDNEYIDFTLLDVKKEWHITERIVLDKDIGLGDE